MKYGSLPTRRTVAGRRCLFNFALQPDRPGEQMAAEADIGEVGALGKIDASQVCVRALSGRSGGAIQRTRPESGVTENPSAFSAAANKPFSSKQ